MQIKQWLECETFWFEEILMVVYVVSRLCTKLVFCFLCIIFPSAQQKQSIKSSINCD